MSRLYYVIVLSFSLISCQIQKSSKVKSNYNIEIQHSFGNEPLKLNQKYLTKSGDTVVFTKVQYYLSNISVTNKESEIWKQEKSYHLFRLGMVNHIWNIPLVIPFENIKEISFAIGIDSIQNSQGQQSGDLDPLNGMFWTWKTGYIFFKIEGYTWNNLGQRFPLIIHIGTDDCFRRVFWEVENSDVLFLKMDLEKVFGINSKLQLKLGQNIQTMGGTKASQVADNFKQTFYQIK